jgi:hypothetical protein
MHANDSVKANPATMANSIAILIGADEPPPTPLCFIVNLFNAPAFVAPVYLASLDGVATVGNKSFFCKEIVYHGRPSPIEKRWRYCRYYPQPT